MHVKPWSCTLSHENLSIYRYGTDLSSPDSDIAMDEVPMLLGNREGFEMDETEYLCPRQQNRRRRGICTVLTDLISGLCTG